LIIRYNAYIMNAVGKFTKNFLFLCDHASISDGKLNALGIFEEINISQIPGTHLKCVLVGNFEINDSTINQVSIEVKLNDPKNNTVLLEIPAMKLPVPRDNKGRQGKINVLLELGNLKLEMEGKYCFKVFMNSEHVSDYEFMVNKVSGNVRPN